MNYVIERQTDLRKPKRLLDYVQTGAFVSNALAHEWSVEVFDNGEPYNIVGIVSGYAVLADGSTVAITNGSTSGNKATLVLPSGVYSQAGQVRLVMVCTNNSDNSVVALDAIYIMVAPGETDEVVDPGTIIPSVTELIADIQAAVNSIPASYTELLAAVAPTFSTSDSYSAGEYVWHSTLDVRKLYRFTADHSAGSWTGSDVAETNIADELTGLKSALQEANGQIESLNTFCRKEIQEVTTGSIDVITGTVVQTTTHLVDVNIPTGTVYKFKLEAHERITEYFLYINGAWAKNCDPETEYTLTASTDITYFSIYCNTNHVVGTGSVTGIVTVITETENSLEERIETIEDDVATAKSDITDLQRKIGGLLPVSLEDTDFYVIGKNLFNGTWEDGKFVNWSNGIVTENSSYKMSELIPIEPNTDYVISGSNNVNGIMYAIYNSNRIYVTGLANTKQFTSPATAAYIRFSCLSQITNVQLEKGTTPTTYEPYKVFVDPECLWSPEMEEDVDEKIENAFEDYDPKITPEKTTFFRISPNLINPATCEDGKYVNQTNGTIGTLSGEMVTDYIPVEGGETYGINQFNNDHNYYIRYAFYTSAKVYISGAYANVQSDLSDILTSPATAAYVRISASNVKFPLMLAKSTTRPIYEAYDNNYIYPQYIVLEDADDIIVNMPSKIYALVGFETNIYFENIVDNWEKYSWNVNCSVGMQLERGYRITPIATDVGTYTLTINIKASDKVIKVVTTTLVVAGTDAGNGNTTSVIVLGDSTTAAGVSIAKLHANFVGDVMTVNTLGTQGTSPNNHEGRSGWTLAYYFTQATNNPFYNPTSKTFDASYYFANSGIEKPNWFFINLGINDMFNYTSEKALQDGIDTSIEYMDSMIDSLKSADESINVGVCLTIPPNHSQDAFGKAYACGQTRNCYKHNNLMWVNRLISEYDNRENEGIYIVPIHAALDTIYNMGFETLPVNARNTSVTYESPVGNGGVHPVESGYWQIADVYTAFLKGNASV